MKKIRFLLSRDDWYHQRGYWVLASALKDAGVEVVLGGIQTPQDVVHTAIEENVDIIGYRIMDAAPKILIPILLDGMRKEGIQDIPVVVGGIIPRKDEIIIRDLGVKEVFHPYTPLDMVVSRVKEVAIASQTKSA
jgi:methylmalonyl-CoA mutase C-terminal domain/subunit